MTGNIVYDSRRIFKHANSFLDCALLYEKEPKNIVVDRMNFYKPLIVNTAFACEIFMKSILVSHGMTLDEIKKCGHTLKELWKVLEKKDEKFTSKIQESFLGFWCDDDLKEFDNLLENISKAFETWRYIYEKNGASINVMFLKWFAEELREECCLKYYNMTWESYSNRE